MQGAIGLTMQQVQLMAQPKAIGTPLIPTPSSCALLYATQQEKQLELMRASTAAEIEALRPYVDLEATIFEDGWTVLIQVAACGHFAAVEALLPHSNLQAADKGGLMWAAKNGHVSVMEVLRPHVDLNQADVDGCTAVMLAAISGHKKL